jgi:hypothetical protein
MDWRGAWYIIINCFFHLKKGTADIREYSIWSNRALPRPAAN